MNCWALKSKSLKSAISIIVLRGLRSGIKRSATQRSGANLPLNKAVDLGFLEQIDAAQTSLVSGRRRAKLHQGLEKRNKTITPSVAMQGLLEATAEDVCTILNEALETSAFAKIFKGCEDTSAAFEFDRVRLSSDCTHAVAYWRSPLMDKFVSLAIDRDGVTDGNRLSRKMNEYVSKRFQNRESAFRSFLIKNMDFRRVPRIAFKHFDED